MNTHAHDHGSSARVTSADAGRIESRTRELVSHPGVDRTLELVVAGAVAALPAVDRAGVSLRGGGDGPVFRVSSDAVAAALGRLQDTTREGPGHDCLRDGATVTVDDLAAVGPGRWPCFTPIAARHGVAAVCSLPLFTVDGIAGAITLYSAAPGAFDPAYLAVAALIASHAAVAVQAARRIAQLHEALVSRDVIGQAKGILIERCGDTDEQAFARIVSASQSTNIKVREVAAHLVTEAVRSAASRTAHRFA